VIYGARNPDHVESIVRPKMLKTFPQLKDVDIDYAWTGNFLLTLSRLPEVGRIGANIFYSQGLLGPRHYVYPSGGPAVVGSGARSS